jgi:hypothetical protein
LNPPDGFGAVTITSTAAGGVTQINAGTGITVSGNTGNVTISTNPNTQVTQLVAGSNISLSPTNGFGAVTISSLATDIPSGTTMLFMQAAAPTGWTKVTSLNDYALRLVSGTGGGTSGTIPFSTFFNATSIYTGTVTITSGQVGDTTLTTAQMPSHDHTVDAIALGCGAVSNGPFQDRPAPGCVSVGSSGLKGASGSHTHSLIGAVAGGNFTSDFNITYVNIIACTKN